MLLLKLFDSSSRKSTDFFAVVTLRCSHRKHPRACTSIALILSYPDMMCTSQPQEAFKVPLVVQLTDDEKFLFKPDLKLEEVRMYNGHFLIFGLLVPRCGNSRKISCMARYCTVIPRENAPGCNQS